MLLLRAAPGKVPGGDWFPSSFGLLGFVGEPGGLVERRRASCCSSCWLLPVVVVVVVVVMVGVCCLARNVTGVSRSDV